MATRKKFRPGQIVVSGHGKDCFMGKVLGYSAKPLKDDFSSRVVHLVRVKYADFVTPRLVPEHELRPLGKS